MSKVYEFGAGKVREHIGGIYDYLRHHNAVSIEQAVSNDKIVKDEKKPDISVKEKLVKPDDSLSKDTLEDSKALYAKRKELQKRIKKAERVVELLEKKIDSLEARKKELDAMLMQEENASNMDLVNEYTILQQNIDAENDNWLKNSEILEELKKEGLKLL